MELKEHHRIFGLLLLFGTLLLLLWTFGFVPTEWKIHERFSFDHIKAPISNIRSELEWKFLFRVGPPPSSWAVPSTCPTVDMLPNTTDINFWPSPTHHYYSCVSAGIVPIERTASEVEVAEDGGFKLTMGTTEDGTFAFIVSDPPARDSAAFYAEFVRTYLDKDNSTGTHHMNCMPDYCSEGLFVCPETKWLPSGDWKVRVTQVRRWKNTTKNPPVSLASLLAGGGTTSSDSSWEKYLSVVDYILAANISLFNEFQQHFDVTPRVVAELDWTHVLTENVIKPLPWCDKFHGYIPGYWRTLSKSEYIPEYETSNGENIVWKTADGYLSSNVFNNELDNGTVRVFTPFLCRMRLFNVQEASQCLRKNPVTLIGDARFEGLLLNSREWIETEIPDFKIFDVWTRLDDYLSAPHGSGLAKFVYHDDALKILADLICSGQTVVLNSMLHDIADYKAEELLVRELQQWDRHSCASCRETSKTAGLCLCTNKRRTIHLYFAALCRLRELIMAAKDSCPSGSNPRPVYWVTQGKRLRSSSDYYDSWQSPDIINELEDRAVAILTDDTSFIRHISFRSHLLNAPLELWKDQEHYHGIMMQYSFLTLLNTLCPMASEPRGAKNSNI